MTFTALGLIVTAAFIHATWNLLAKQASGGPAFVWLYSLATFILYAPVIIILVLLDPPEYGLGGWIFIGASGHPPSLLLGRVAARISGRRSFGRVPVGSRNRSPDLESWRDASFR